MTRNDLEHYMVDPKQCAAQRFGIFIRGLQQQDLLKVFDIECSFDWALPQGWIDQNKIEHPGFNAGNYVWAYPKGSFMGQPFMYTYLWDVLFEFLFDYFVNPPAAETRYGKGDMATTEFPRLKYSL